MRLQPTVYHKIGSVIKPHGRMGAIKVDIDESFLPTLTNLKFMFFKKNGAFVPYFIEEIESGEIYVVKIEEVDTPESAKIFSGKSIYLRSIDMDTSKVNTNFLVNNLESYQLYNNGNFVGQILAIEPYPQQMMMSIKVGEKTILIPLIEVWVQSIQVDKKKIFMNFPEELLYL